jgi:DNA gyrase/topoisomerase IV subunit A
MDEKMFRDYIVLESRLKESVLTISEMSYDLNNLESYQRDLLEIIDEKNKDIADLAQELREVKEKLMKLRAYEKNH